VRATTRYREIDASGTTTFEDFLEFRTKNLSKDGIEKQLSQWFTSSVTSFGNTCTTTYSIKIVNGEVKYERSATQC
jgi:hypothetical protein